MWDLTVPWEENIEEAHERKISKYDELLEEWQSNGWKAQEVLLQDRFVKLYQTLALSGPQNVEQLSQYPIQPKGQQNGNGCFIHSHFAVLSDSSFWEKQ